jgi:hypothetical protein
MEGRISMVIFPMVSVYLVAPPLGWEKEWREQVTKGVENC